jgi:type IV pilus assembly protein PilA
LIELIVVIAILGILAAIAIPRFMGTLDNAKTKADDATERVVNSAVQLYYAEEGSFPATLDDLDGDYLIIADLKWSNGAAILSTSAIDATTGDVTFDPVRP